MKTSMVLVLTAALWLPASALAHGEKIGPNGGVVEDAGKYHVELVMKNDGLRAFVTDAKDVKVDTKGAAATAIVLVGKEKATVKLAPAGGTELAAGGKFDAAAGAKVVVSLTLQGQPAAQARFTLPAKK
ncbi:MAG: hypothetical protein HY661_10250 [Betaproteobacteria bacterium]|nr:hypothetical protein [Betaproteobacteria bacterium]